MIDSESVRLGALFLDGDKPEWAGNINTETLDPDDPFDCIAGQTYGKYGHLEGAMGEQWMIQHGFKCDGDGEEDCYCADLEPLWHAEIETRCG